MTENILVEELSERIKKTELDCDDDDRIDVQSWIFVGMLAAIWVIAVIILSFL